MHHLDPRAKSVLAEVPQPMDVVVEDAPSEPAVEFPKVLADYEQYVVHGGQCGFGEWASRNNSLPPGTAVQIPLPRSIFTDRNKSSTPIRDMLTGRNEQHRREVLCAIESILIVSPEVPWTASSSSGSGRPEGSKAKRRLAFEPPLNSPAGPSTPEPSLQVSDEPMPVTETVEEVLPPTTPGVELARQIKRAVETNKPLGFVPAYMGSGFVLLDELDLRDDYIPSLLYELLMQPGFISAYMECVMLAPPEGNADAQRRWEGRHAVFLAASYCAQHVGTKVHMRDLAVHILLLRSPFRRAAIDHIFMIARCDVATVQTWLAAYTALSPAPVPLWKTMDVDPKRTDFEPPYVSVVDLSDAGATLRVAVRTDGRNFTDYYAELAVRVIAFCAAAAASLDPPEFNAAAKRAMERPFAYVPPEDHIAQFAFILDCIAQYVCTRAADRDSYLSFSVVSSAFKFGDVRASWVKFVEVAVALNHALPVMPQFVFGSPMRLAEFDTAASRGIHSITAQYTKEGVYAGAITFEENLCAQGPWRAWDLKHARSLTAFGMFLSSLVGAIWGRQPRETALAGKKMTDLDATSAIITCVKHAHIWQSPQTTSEFHTAVVQRIRETGQEAALIQMWETWLPVFAEARVHCLGVDGTTGSALAVLAAKMEIQPWESKSLVAAFVMSP